MKKSGDATKLSLGQSISILYVLIEGIIMTEGLWLNYRCESECVSSHLVVGGVVVPLLTALVWLLGTKIVFELGLRTKRRRRPTGKSRTQRLRTKLARPFDVAAIGVSFLMAALIVVSVVTIGIYSFRFEVPGSVTEM